MPNRFSETVFDILSGGDLPVYNFVDIYLDGPQTLSNSGDLSFFADIHICDWIRQIVDDSAEEHVSTTVSYTSDLLKGIEAPARTGNVTQEVQKLVIAQTLGLWDDPAEFVNRLGNKFHGATIVVRNLLEINDAIAWDQPLNRSEGIIKGISRSLSSDDVTIEFTNTYGKLDTIKEFSTNIGSIKKFKEGDTSFDRASVDANNKITNWGGRR